MAATVKPMSALEQGRFTVMGAIFTLAAKFSRTGNQIAVDDLHGSLVSETLVKGRTLYLRNSFGIRSGVYVVIVNSDR
jgi:hypothetical protein